MGCGPSQEDSPRERKRKGRKGDKGKGREKDRELGSPDNMKEIAPASTGNPLKGELETTSSRLVGKDKYISEVGAVVMALENGTLIVFAPDEEGLTFAFRDNQGGTYVKEFLTDGQIETDKNAAGIDAPWGSFFKSIASDVLKCKAKVVVSGNTVQVTVTITSSKDPKYAKPWTVRLSSAGHSPRELHRLFIVPMTMMVQRRRTQTGDASNREDQFIRIETGTAVATAGAVVLRRKCHDLKIKLDAPRAKAAEIQRHQFVGSLEVSNAQRKVMRVRGDFRGQALDAMYEQGGPRFFLHMEHSPDHVPKEEPVNANIATAIREVFATGAEGFEARLKTVPTSPVMSKLLQAHPTDRALVDGVMQTLQRLDEWDFDVFAMDGATRNKSLVFTTYAILLKLGLVDHFRLDLPVLHSFLAGIQAGYHPNPYHNATHAADVAQINYYIMTKGGLADKCKLSKEELLASVLAGAIHDFDHPGFNNNFHTRTNAYLSTLYNDRSVLENHHCACVYEMLRLPKYNIFAKFTEEQKREVRDTMLEMVLSTDMGNHGKIFQAFRKKLSERPPVDWSAGKEDLRLALSISIKMADISNCGRPSKLYLEWAKNIASEFYVQGDAEAKLCLPISPFMDRSKDKQEFPKGQISFMNFVVIPMFEAISEFLPNMEFCLKHCTENKEYWQALDA